MKLRLVILSFILSIVTCGNAQIERNASGHDLFSNLIQLVIKQVPPSSFIPSVPTEQELSEWGNLISLFKHGARDSCKILLQQFNYRLTELHDPATGNTYDVFKEEFPIQRGWGTFIYNRNHRKRLYIHVTHPVDDFNTPFIGGELLRDLKGEWLYIAGASKASQNISLRNSHRVRWSVFHRWHEVLSDLTHLTLSLHGFAAIPGTTPDIVVSNGRTSDDQWGISQISMAFRDSMRASGFRCVLAMYDSGFAKLAGRLNQEGMFSNDSVGFGHWLNLELSLTLRSHASLRERLVIAANRALGITGSRVSHQVNRAFGLVSPRVLRIDSDHRILFPPPSGETFRIVSFNPAVRTRDTIDVQMGNWLNTLGGRKSITTVTRLDSTNDFFSRTKNQKRTHSLAEQIFGKSSTSAPEIMEWKTDAADSSMLGELDPGTAEQLQVHRIPLQRVPVPTYVRQISHQSTPYVWNGILSGSNEPTAAFFQMSNNEKESDQIGASTKFLIPIINNSLHADDGQFIGIRMTEVLMGEIARLVNEHDIASKDIGLLAERGEEGDYYLRIFPRGTFSKK